jgi:hypothetical protein
LLACLHYAITRHGKRSRKKMRLFWSLHPGSWVRIWPESAKVKTVILALAAWSRVNISSCHREDRGYGSWDRIPPGYRVIVLKNNNKLKRSFQIKCFRYGHSQCTAYKFSNGKTCKTLIICTYNDHSLN